MSERAEWAHARVVSPRDRIETEVLDPRVCEHDQARRADTHREDRPVESTPNPNGDGEVEHRHVNHEGQTEITVAIAEERDVAVLRE